MSDSATPKTASCQAPLSRGFYSKKTRGLPCPPPGDLSHPGTELTSLMSAALTDGFFSTAWEALRKREVTNAMGGMKDHREGRT